MPDAEALKGVLDPMPALMLPGTMAVLAWGVPLPGKGTEGCACFEGDIPAGIGAITTGCVGTWGLLSAGSGPGVAYCVGVAEMDSAGKRAGATPAAAVRMLQTMDRILHQHDTLHMMPQK